ncbi:UNVERIFIED_CONTAM: hypothetical protein HDU68_012784 [Siphonaria sp. JEL0065]|nr:hypothetical protein HDU68_012784 [Siphonaria sp. JEL0065]
MDTPQKALSSLYQNHGAAGLIVLQILGWATFLVLYFGLLHFEVDPAALCHQYKLTFFQYVFDKGGVTLLAYLLNRGLAPIRFQVAKAVLPSVAQPINKLVEPIVSLFRKAEKEEKKNQ